MAWCQDRFDRFNESIRLNSTRQGRIDSAIRHLSDFCKSDGELASALAGPLFLQGSVPYKCAVKPIESDEYDVDVVYPFRLLQFDQERQTPRGIINWFAARLRTDGYYRDRMTPKDRCVRIDYAGDFHMDVIPLTSDLMHVQPFAVPSKDLNQWLSTDPRGFVDWVRQNETRSGSRDADGDGRFVRAVRYAKRWRDHFFTASSAPSSILLTTMLGKHEPHLPLSPQLPDPLTEYYDYDAAYLYDMFRYTDDCLARCGGASFFHPTLDENLARGWDRDYLSGFRTQLSRSIDHLRIAIWAEDEADAVRHYEAAFGPNFPTS